MIRRASALLVLLSLAGLAVPGFGQMGTSIFYGKNKINYEKFAWKNYPTEHFRIYFYNDDPRILKAVVEMAESAYKKISFDLKHQLSDPVPLLYYNTITDFEQSNVFQVSEGVLGVSEPILFRIGIHGDMPPDDLQDLLTHELTHIFEFDLLWGNQGGALTAVNQPPLWIFEGLSEYTTDRWSSWSRLILRDAVLNDRIPEIAENGELFSRYPLPREPAYDFGHAMYEFIVEKYGPNSIRDLWLSLKGAGLLARPDPFQRAFRISARVFSQEFKRWLRARTKDFLTRETPEDYSLPLGPEFPMNPYYFAFSHAVSPSGELVATVTYNALDYKMDIVLLSAKDGRILKNITKGYTTDYQYIKYEIDPSLGATLAWSPDGDRLLFFARDGRRHNVFIISPLTGETLKKIPLTLDQPSGACFLPDGKSVIFAAFRRGIRDLFALDLQTGVATALTDDELYEKGPAVSPDGKSIVYTLRIGTVDKLFLSPLTNLKTKTQLTFGPSNTVCPSFAPDGQTIYYAGDGRGAYNIYSLSLTSGEIRRHTDVRTGNFLPVPLPGEPGKILFSSFNKGAFQLFTGHSAGPVEETVSFDPAAADKPFQKFEPVLTFEVNKEKIETHKGMGKLYVSARPPVDAVVSTDGSIYGGSAIAFSDIMGNHQFQIMAYQVRDFRSYSVGYYNLTGRLQTSVSLFQYSFFYYPELYYYNPSLFTNLTYNDATAVRKISGAVYSLYYPLNVYLRAEAGVGIYHYEEDFNDPYGMGLYGNSRAYGFVNGSIATASVALTGETTTFKQFGPLAGSTFRLALSQGLPVSDRFLRNTSIDLDARKYLPIASDILLAARFEGRLCRGRNPFLSYYGGNNQVRSAYFYSLTATEYWFANAELRFPVLGATPSILGTIGPVRGVFFFDVTRSRYGDYPAEFYNFDATYTSGPIPYYRISQAIGSVGYGIQVFLFGLPFHFEWAKRLEWSDFKKPFNVTGIGTYDIKFWIGYDF
jgi:hypothetical protein